MKQIQSDWNFIIKELLYTWNEEINLKTDIVTGSVYIGEFLRIKQKLDFSPINQLGSFHEHSHFWNRIYLCWGKSLIFSSLWYSVNIKICSFESENCINFTKNICIVSIQPAQHRIEHLLFFQEMSWMTAYYFTQYLH